MKSILKELYMGNIGFDSGFYGPDSPFVKAARRRFESEEKLNAMLDEHGKKSFEEYREAQADMQEIVRYDVYLESLKFGMMLMTELFTGASCLPERDRCEE